MPFAALGGDEVFELGFDASVIVEHRWFKQLLKIQKLDKLLRHGDVIPSLPKRIIPKRIPFYFQFLPRQSLSHIQSVEDLKRYREALQQDIYTAIEQLKRIRAEQHSTNQ